MKKNLLLLMIAATCFSTAQAQEQPNPATYHNEFGIDATAFIRQFFNPDQQNISTYEPVYYLTYRRHFKCGNIRAAIGGSFQSQEIPSAFADDKNEYEQHLHTINFRIGWEFYNNLSKRWQVYYGLDFRPGFYYEKNDATFWNGGYANGIEAKSQNYGFAPLLGFRFKLTNRLSLTTEASFSINVRSTSSRNYFIPVTNQFPPLPDVENPKVKSVFTNFSQPLSIILTFDI